MTSVHLWGLSGLCNGPAKPSREPKSDRASGERYAYLAPLDVEREMALVGGAQAFFSRANYLVGLT